MPFQPDPSLIQWRLYLNAPIQQVYNLLATNEGRARFWAESAVEVDGIIKFEFPDGQTWAGKILQAQPPALFQVEYYGGSITTFHLSESASGGTELYLTDANVPPEDCCEVIAGWVSVLMTLKAAVDFSVDLRNHDPHRTWLQGYAEN
jgi:uncharacterized protein YndB with AHSA1/START domain